jgi:small conductance mechanosensitive channel
MDQIVKTIVTSLQELLGSAIKAMPGIITALIVLMLTRYAAEYARKIAEI